MRVLRSREPEQVRRDALKVAERKAAEGCMPCAEAYLAVAEQHGASPQAIGQARLGRRAMLARAGLAAGALSALSLADPTALFAAHSTSDQPKLEPVGPARARALLRQAQQDPAVRLLEVDFTSQASLVAYRIKDAGELLTRSEGDRRLVVLLVRGGPHAALYVAETAFRAATGTVHEDPELTERYRGLRRASSEQRGGLASTVTHLLAPAEAAAACPACPQLLGACALGFEACRRGCVPCCAVGAAACLAAVTCCAQPG